MEMLKPPAETLYEAELRALQQEDQGHRPPNWLLSPAYVRDFIIGREATSDAGWRENQHYA